MRISAQVASLLVLTAAATAYFGCSATGSANDKAAPRGADGEDAGKNDTPGLSDCNACEGNTFIQCDDLGKVVDTIDCGSQVCVSHHGCRDCRPSEATCVGNDVHHCEEDGTVGGPIETCDVAVGEFCVEGRCSTECQLNEGSPSNVGCEFWAVQLPNERASMPPFTPAAIQPWGVVLSNASPATARVTIDYNSAPPGEPMQLKLVTVVDIPPLGLRQIELPRRHITGEPTLPDPPGPPYTWLSSGAFRITSSVPIIAYQLNTLTNDYSNDASLLLPRTGLGTQHRILGYPTANPIYVPGLAPAGMPDRSSVTVIGVSPNTKVTITASTTTNGNSQGIPPLQPGEQVTVELGPYDVFNIASDGMPGDMTGTIVESNLPVAVFSSGERAILPGSSQPPNPRPDASDLCCTDHIEEQIFPITSLGKDFVITRSPPRTKGTYLEPDLLRFLGVAETTQVKTTLPPPDHVFTLEPGQLREVWTTTDVIVESTKPVMIGQLLVSQTYTDAYIGDPSLTIFPPVEQYRKGYIFLIPPSWTANYVVIATPVGNTFELDGEPLPTDCFQAPIGLLHGTEYEVLRCPLEVGTHTLTGEQAFGITAYGYGSAGSYAYVGGADVKKIYEPPPIK